MTSVMPVTGSDAPGVGALAAGPGAGGVEGGRAAAVPVDLGGARTRRAAELLEALSLDLPAALSAAAAIGLADELALGPLPYGELAHRCGAAEEPLRRLCRYLVAVDLLQPSAGAGGGQDSKDAVALSPVGHVLRSDHPSGVHWRALNTHLSRALLGLEHAVRTGESSYEAVHGEPMWSRLGRVRTDRQAFDGLMTKFAGTLSVPAALAWDWKSSGHVVDLGGGTGVVLDAVMSRHPHLSATLVDAPAAVRCAARRLAESGHSRRCAVIGGDMFAAVLPAADTYLLARVLHNCDDERAAALLRSVRRALGAGGRLLVVDGVLPDEPRPHPMLASDLRMLAYMGGRERTLAELSALLGSCGFEVAERRLPDAAVGLLVARPV